MSFIVGTLIAFLFLDGIWKIALIAGVALLELAEIALWLKWRKVTSSTGVEAMVGMTGVALSDCRPDGQVRVKGQIWNDTSSEPLTAGDKIEVTRTEGLRHHVARR